MNYHFQFHKLWAFCKILRP